MLLREYAIDPAVMANWDTSKAIFDGMGAQHGRMWNPVWKQKAWKAKVRDLVAQAELAGTIGTVHCKSIREKHLPHLERTMWPVRPDLAETTPWIDAAKNSHSTHPYHAIVSDASPGSCPQLATADLSPHHSLWDPGPSVPAQRTVAGLTGCVEGILRASSQLVFIEPYFGKKITNAEMVKPMKAYIQQAGKADSARSQPLKWIEIHTAKQSRMPEKSTWENFVAQLRLPLDISISLVWWDGSALHNRYILGELCGASFGHGLDTGASTSCRTDTVGRLSETERQQHWNNHLAQTAQWKISEPDRVW